MSKENLDHKQALPAFKSEQGEGYICNDGHGDVPVSFVFEQYQDGSIHLNTTILCETQWDAMYKLNECVKLVGDAELETRFYGTTNNNYRLDVPHLVLVEDGNRERDCYLNFAVSEATFTLPDDFEPVLDKRPYYLMAPLVNLRFSPLTATNVFKNGYEVIGQQIPLNLDGQELTLCYSRNASETLRIIEKSRSVGVTTHALMPVTELPNRDDFMDMMGILCALLTFTHDTLVNWIAYEVYNSKGQLIQRYHANMPTSEYKNGSNPRWSTAGWIPSISDFIEKAYLKFQQLEDEWNIFALIRLYIELHGHFPIIEVTGLHLCTCLEILIRTYKDRKNETGMHFYRHLKECCSDLGFEVEEDDLMRVRENRNSLTHEGLFYIPETQGNPRPTRPRERWMWYETKVNERLSELRFMDDFVGTLIFTALGGNKKLEGY